MYHQKVWIELCDMAVEDMLYFFISSEVNEFNLFPEGIYFLKLIHERDFKILTQIILAHDCKPQIRTKRNIEKVKNISHNV